MLLSIELEIEQIVRSIVRMSHRRKKSKIKVINFSSNCTTPSCCQKNLKHISEHSIGPIPGDTLMSLPRHDIYTLTTSNMFGWKCCVG